MRPSSAGPSKGDEEAAWAKHRARPPAHGHKAHIAADKDTGIIRKVATAPANAADVSMAPSIVPDAPGGENFASGILGGHVFGDKAYDAASAKKAIEDKGGSVKILRQGHRWLAAKKFAARNRKLAPIRAGIEKIFGPWKRSYRLRTVRRTGLAKARLQIHLAAIAYNVNRFWRLKSARAGVKGAPRADFSKRNSRTGNAAAEQSARPAIFCAEPQKLLPASCRPPPFFVPLQPAPPHPGLVSRETFFEQF